MSTPPPERPPQAGVPPHSFQPNSPAVQGPRDVAQPGGANWQPPNGYVQQTAPGAVGGQVQSQPGPPPGYGQQAQPGYAVPPAYPGYAPGYGPPPGYAPQQGYPPSPQGAPQYPAPYAGGQYPAMPYNGQPGPAQGYYQQPGYPPQGQYPMPVNVVVQNNLQPVAPAGLMKVGDRSKTTAALLAILIPGLGIHKFYLGRPVAGLLYLLFFWTTIPFILSYVEGVLLLLQNEQDFNLRYNYRIAP